MSDNTFNDDKPRNSMELLIETYASPDIYKPDPPKQPQQPQTITEENTSSRSSDIISLQIALNSADRELTKAGIELNQLPTDVTKRLFEKYEFIKLHLGRLLDDVETILNS